MEAGPTDPVVDRNCRIGKRSTVACCPRSSSYAGSDHFGLHMSVSNVQFAQNIIKREMADLLPFA